MGIRKQRVCIRSRWGLHQNRRDIPLAIEESTDQGTVNQRSAEEMADSPEQARPASRRFRRFVFLLRWPMLYLATIAAIIGWYEVGRGELAASEMEGTWRVVEGEFDAEEFTDSHLFVSGNETWFGYPADGSWQVQRSRISVKPANDFYLVTREFGFDYGNTRSTEYILFRKGDQLYILHGLARLDSVRDYSAQKFRRVEQLPAEAVDAIDAYLLRHREVPET